MEKPKIRDMIVILPGISGSVLTKNGQEVYGDSFAAVGHGIVSTLKSFWNGQPTLIKSLKDLQLTGIDNDPTLDDLDGVKATRLIDGVTIIPGFKKIDGYKNLRGFISENCDNIIIGNNASDKPANYFEFPYDWRRDNRFTANKLAEFVRDKLKNWRTVEPDAEVIFIAHSMGGLICRYYLECLEGRRDCKALITLGTPYQGSVMQLEYLVNGYKEFGLIDLTAPLRSFSSCYQLLPTYETVKVGDKYQYPIKANLPNLDPTQMTLAWRFHHEIQEAIKNNSQLKTYKLLSIVGVNQPTLQSVQYESGILKVRYDIYGDGTVPKQSARPRDADHDVTSIYMVAKHGSMQSDYQTLLQLLHQLGDIESTQWQEMPYFGIGDSEKELPGLSLDVADLFLPGEPMTLQVKLIGEKSDGQPLIAEVEQIETNQLFELQLPYTNDSWSIEQELPPGTYRVTVKHPIVNQQVVDLFAVI